MPPHVFKDLLFDSMTADIKILRFAGINRGGDPLLCCSAPSKRFKINYR